jgi:CHAT domain
MSVRPTLSPAPLNLDVLFWPDGADFCAQVVGSPVGQSRKVTFPLPCTDSELTDFIRSDCRFQRTLIPTPGGADRAKALGGRLFDAVFSGPVLECLRSGIDEAIRSGSVLRIRLRLSNCPSLVNLPWELLYDRERGGFLVLSARTPVIRYTDIRVPEPTARIELPLHVLAIRSAPRGTQTLKTSAEWGGIRTALARVNPQKVRVTEMENPSLEDLCQVLSPTRRPVHVLHYMGHGTFEPGTGGALVFCGRYGLAQFATADQLKVLLADQASLRLVVLNSCEGGRTDPADHFAGVADALVGIGIPSVIAMQFEVTDRAAVAFGPMLFEMLADGSQVDSALTQARKALTIDHGLEWATPVLYSRADDTRLLDPGEWQDQPEQSGETGGDARGNSAPPDYLAAPGPPGPEIEGVFISGDPGDYRVSVRGSGLGQPACGFPSRTIMPNFRVAVITQHGIDESGCAGAEGQLTFESWGDQEVVVTALAANPGDAIILALWDDNTGAGACWGGNVPPVLDTGPEIEDVQFSGPAIGPIADIRGRGFGPPPCAIPGIVSADHLIVSNWRDHPRGSTTASTWTTGVTLRIASWTDNRILISAFTGTFGAGRDTFLPGDPLSIILHRTQGNGRAAAQTAWAGRFTQP